MNYEKLRSILSRSNFKVFIVALVIMLLGGALALYPFYTPDFEGITSAMVLFGGVFILAGVVALKRVLVDQIKAKRNTHPLLKAIKEGQRDYLVWMYIQQIDTTLGHDGETIGTSANINYFSKDSKGKGKTIVLGKNDSSKEVIDYLYNQFDIPYLGYADDTRAAVNKHFGTSGLRKL